MAWTQDDLQALRAAYSAGTLSVRLSDGSQVTYPSGDDLMRRIRTLEADLAAQSGAPRPVASFASFRRPR